MAMERTHNEPFTFEIMEHLTVIAVKNDGWSKELNLVSWNGQQPPKFDIREWSPDHTKMSKGITLYDYEMRKVSQAYLKYCNARTVSESRNNKNAAAEAGLRAGEEAARALEENTDARPQEENTDARPQEEDMDARHQNSAPPAAIQDTSDEEDVQYDNEEDFVELSEGAAGL